MKNWSRLILPLGLGVLATVINAGVMNTRLTPVVLVSVNKDIEPGQKFTEQDLKKVEVGYPSAHLKDHFFTWDEREALLSEVGAVTRLKKGELVPKVEFGDYGRSTVSIPEDSLLIGFRFHESATERKDRRLLIPGKKVKLTFRDGGVVSSATIESLELSKAIGAHDATGQYYQMCVLIDRVKKAELALLVTQQVNQVIGMSDGGSGL